MFSIIERSSEATKEGDDWYVVGSIVSNVAFGENNTAEPLSMIKQMQEMHYSLWLYLVHNIIVCAESRSLQMVELSEEIRIASTIDNEWLTDNNKKTLLLKNTYKTAV